jgi:hypothetical protein
LQNTGNQKKNYILTFPLNLDTINYSTELFLTMVKKLLKTFYKMLPHNFQQRILKYNIKKAMKIKQSTIEQFQKNYGYTVLIETGTFLGDMIEAQRNNFTRIFSIELQRELAEKARERFKGVPHIKILQGDSGKLLKTILAEVKEPAIFWLDAHYSGGLTAKGDKECPIYDEIDAILTTKENHLVLVDDARCFNGKGDYPAIDELTKYIQDKDSRYKVSVENDIIRFMI